MSSLRVVPPRAVGIGWRPELAADLFAEPTLADFVEVVADTCFAQPHARREARALAELWPVVPHGVKLSLGSAAGVDLRRASALGALARELRAPAISEHVAMTRAGQREIGHLTPLPFTLEAVRVVARNVAATRRKLPDVPFLLENIAWTLGWPDDALSEGDFYAEIVTATGCDLLLDVANLYANAINSGREPLDLLRSYPLEHVGMVHLAGGLMEDGFYLDTHAHAISEEVFALLQVVFEQAGAVPVLVERDAGFPAFGQMRGELERARELARSATVRQRPRGGPVAALDIDAAGLARRQAELAALLTRATPPTPAEAQPFGARALARTRSVLQHKRLDDALPLLARSQSCGSTLREVAADVVFGSVRETPGGAIGDALRIAEAAARDPRLAAAARLDLLELRARFGAGRRPRLGPWLGRDKLPDGRGVWAFKGPGREAAVLMYGDR